MGLCDGDTGAEGSRYWRRVFIILLMPHYPSEIEYSERYDDGDYEYRHVVLTKEVFKKLPRNRLLS